MRNFSKTLISMAAVMAVGSAMAAGAMAEEIDPVLTIGTPVANETGTAKSVTITGVREGLDQYTMIMVKGNNAVEDAKQDTYTISDGSEQGSACTIIQIDQNDNKEPFDSAVVPVDIADGNYMVVVGGSDGHVQRGYLDLSTVPVVPPVEPVPYTIGNVDGNKKINNTDALCVIRYVAYEEQDKDKTSSTYTGNVGDGLTLDSDEGELLVGNVDGNKKINNTDALCVIRYVAYEEQDKDKTSSTYTGNVADEVDIIE